MSDNGNALVPATVTVPAQRSSFNSFAELMQLGEVLFKSGMFKVSSPAQAVAKILAGRELGFGPVASLVNIHCYEGTIDIGAHIRAASIRKSGIYDYKVVERSDAACEIRFLQRQGEKWVEMDGSPLRYTLEEAHRKKWHLTNAGKEKTPWMKTPANMLFARVITDGFKVFCPDLTGGVLTYDADEIEDFDPQPLPPPAPQPETPSPEPEPVQDQAEEPHPLQEPSEDGLLDTTTVDRIVALVNSLKLNWETFNARLLEVYQVDSLRKLTRDQAVEMIGKLTAALAERRRKEAATAS